MPQSYSQKKEVALAALDPFERRDEESSAL